MKNTHLPTTNSAKPSSDEAGDRRDAVLHEHRELVEKVGQVEQWVSGNPLSDGWGPGLRTELLELTEMLRGHFGGEAEGQLFAEFMVEFPRFASRLSRLTAEHAEIIKAFRSVADQADAPRASAELLQGLAARTKAAIATLRRHEAEENEIIMSAYLEDLGGAD